MNMNMDSNNGFVYVRQHIYYENDEICKLGRSKNIPDRDNGYATGEYRRGKFILVIEISNNQIFNDIFVEKILQRYFKNYHCKINGGNEFYQNNIIDEIVPFLSNTLIKFKVLSEEEINCRRMGRQTRKHKELLEQINQEIAHYEQYLTFGVLLNG